jgi:trk system potassium uptake protein
VNVRALLHLLSYLLIVIGLGMAASWGISLHFDDPAHAVMALSHSSVITLVIGLAFLLVARSPVELTRRDGFGIVTLGWVASALVGALPYVLSGTIPDFTSAVFESMSGFTTTGASVLDRLEELPRGIIFWRALTHFFGGMGVLVLCVAILPFLGVGGMQIYRAEMPGPAKDRLTPRIASTAKVLWGVYILLCLLETLLLMRGGLSWFDALCHSFASVATGGFSTRTASIMAYDSLYVEIVITVFMFLAGANFALHYRLLRGRPFGYARDPEFRVYLSILAAATLFVSLNTWKSVYPGFGSALRAAVFQCTSLMTTTGFATADFDRWPPLSKFVLVLLMFVGGCAGSTAGGIKVVRIFVVFKEMIRQMVLFMKPQLVIQLKLGRDRIEPGTVANIVAFFMIYVLVFAAASLVMCRFTPDLQSGLTSVAATLGNVGPGLGVVGPMVTYAAIPGLGKLILIFCMMLGRLELYTVLVLFLPGFWKR